MISVGGVHEFENWQTWTDPWTNGLGIFDLTALSWMDDYNHTAAPYERSSLVATYYSSNARYPVSWADPALQAIFEANTTSTPTSSSLAPNPTSSTGLIPSSEPGNTGTIAGGTVGGLVALAIIGGVIFWYLRNKSRSIQGTVITRVPTYLSGPAEMDLNPATRTELPVNTNCQTIPTVIHEAPGRGLTVYELHTEL